MCTEAVSTDNSEIFLETAEAITLLMTTQRLPVPALNSMVAKTIAREIQTSIIELFIVSSDCLPSLICIDSYLIF